MIIQRLNDTVEVLTDLNDKNSDSHFLREAGFLLRFNELLGDDDDADCVDGNLSLSVEDMEELGEDKIHSLYSYGFKINGSDSERIAYTKEILYVECENSVESIVSGFNRLRPKLSKSKENIVVVLFEDIYEPVYSSELHDIAQDFTSAVCDYNVKIYTFDLVNEVCGDRYAVKCLGANGYTDLSDVYHHVTNNEDLLELESKISNGNKYIVYTHLSNKLNDIDIWVLGYIALRRSAVFLFEDSKFDVMYNLICKKLFSHEWGMLSDVIRHILSLEGNYYIVQTESNKFKPCMVTSVETSYEFSVVSLKDVYNDIPDAVLAHTLKKRNVVVRASDVADSALVMEKLWAMCGKDIAAYLKILRKIQVTCLSTLTDRLIGINNICWIIDKGDILFGVPSINHTKVGIAVFTGEDSSRQMEVPQSSILPLSVFASDFVNIELPVAGKSTVKEINYDSLVNISNARSTGNYKFTLLMNEGKLREAFALLNYPISEADNELYKRILQITGRSFCDRLMIELDGKLEPHLNLSPIL